MPMHEDEVRATPELVEGLVAEQCPQWHGLPVTALPDDVEGTDNVLFRLGDALVERMPKVEWAAQQADSDARPTTTRGRGRSSPGSTARPRRASAPTTPRSPATSRTSPCDCARSTPRAAPPSQRARAAPRSPT